MADRFFLYIDILGFKDLIRNNYDIMSIYKDIDELNVHTDTDFQTIVFSDTIIVYGHEVWNSNPNQAIMWLTEFSQDLFYRLISKDIQIRAYITFGDINHHKLKNLEAYYGEALVKCYERERNIKCTGIFLDASLSRYSDIFHLTQYDDMSYYVHVMQNLDEISCDYDQYPFPGEYVEDTGMEWWIAYQLRYLENTYRHAHDASYDQSVREKYAAAWKMISSRHPGLTRQLEEADFDFGKVITLDWSEPMRRIGTEDGAWG